MIRPTYTIDLEHGCIFIKWSGIVKAHDIIAFNREIEQDPDYRSGLNRLADFRQAEVVAESDEMRAVVREVIERRDANEGHRKAAILVSGDLQFGRSRMYITMADQTRPELRPFRRLDEAMAWLGLPETLGDPFEENSN